MSSYGRYAEARGRVDAPIDDVFSFLDDHSNLAAHMSRPSAMMLGSSLQVHMEADRTRRVGSKFGFDGRLLGLPLSVEEVVTAREPPASKQWVTTSEPRLWVIGRYVMGFSLTPEADGGTMLRVHIRYDLPPGGLERLLGRLLGGLYARWCTEQMVSDALRHFEKPAGAKRPSQGKAPATAPAPPHH